ncbi:unnamed protein product [Cuscuta europaea]|uniref:Uncharacterized protein n=1 Tax=Cuscuta europaea TaxID=41803 RepID=A0A9P1EL00_CUSEU|nr:unnamed protein product [Cuscuta europaea]
MTCYSIIYLFTPIDVFQDKKWLNVPWKKLQVGDILKVKQDEFLRVDISFLASTNLDGICYIEVVLGLARFPFTFLCYVNYCLFSLLRGTIYMLLAGLSMQRMGTHVSSEMLWF